jgi:hypothetical protein
MQLHIRGQGNHVIDCEGTETVGQIKVSDLLYSCLPLKSENACCHSVQNILSSSLLSESVKITIYRTIILPVVLYGCET